MKKTLTRILCLVLVICTMVGMMPTSAFAVFGQGKHSTSYDSEVMDVLTETTGSEESASEVLDSLYSAGLVDENGQYVENPTFEVNGETVTADALLEMAEEHQDDEEVTVDGETTTWGTVCEYIEAAKDLAALMDLQESEAPLTEEHVDTLRSLLENLQTGISMGGEAQLASVSDHKTWPDTAVSEIALNTKTNTSTNKKYIEVAGFGDSGYSASYPFYLASQNSTAAYTDSRYDGSGISHSARVSVSYSKESVAANAKKDQTITVTAKLSIAQPAEVSFDYRAVAGSWSAVEGSGTVTWAAGETGTKTFTITVKAVENPRFNGYSTFYIQCYNISNALFAEDKTVVDKQINVTAKADIKSASGTVDIAGVFTEPNGSHSYLWNGSDPGTPFNGTKTFTLPEITGDALDMTLAWKLHANYYMSMTPNHSGDFSTQRDGQHSLTFYNNALGINKTITRSYGLYDPKKSFTVDEDVASGGALGSDLSNAVVSVTQSITTWQWKSDYGSYWIWAGYNGVNKYTFSYWDATTDLGVKSVSIPEGKFYIGQQVPITVTYTYFVYSDDCTGLSLTVNGETLTPVEKNTLGKTFTYLYTVKELDTGTPTITNFGVAANKVRGLNWSSVQQNYLTKKEQTFDSIPGVKNTKCSLQTPAKMSSFTDVQVGCDDEDPAKQTIIVNMPIDATEESGNYPYIAWIAANQAYSSKGTTVKLADGTEREVHNYVKSMYVSYDGGATRYPLWIVTKEEAITLTKPDGSQYQAGEFPTNLVANIAPGENSTADFRVDTLEIFVDPEIDSAVDYLANEKNKYKQDSLDNAYYLEGEGAPTAGLAIGYGFSVYVKGVVLLENNYTYTEGGVTKTDGQDVAISYSAEWLSGLNASTTTTTIKGKASPTDETEGTEMERKVYEYYVQNEQDMMLEYVISDRYNEGDSGKQAEEYYGKTDFTFQSYEWMQWTSSDETIASVDDTGDVYFILTPLNGGNPNVQFYLYSDVVRVKAGLTPFMQINKSNRDKVVLEDTAATVYFTSNIAERNQAENGDDYETTVTAKLYRYADVKVNEETKTVTVGDAEVLWTGSITSPTATQVYSDEAGDYVTEYVPNNGIVIPAEKIVKIASGSEKDYVVVVSANFQKAGEEPSELSAYATLQVKPAPAKPQLGQLNEESGAIEDLDSYFVLSDAVPVISYQVKNAKSGAEVYYTIKDSKSLNYTSAVTSDASGTIPATYFTAPSDSLKNIYTVSLYARNSAEDAWTCDSMSLNVYNADALQLVVTAAKSMEIGGYTGGKADSDKNLIEDGKVSFEKLSLVKELLNGNKRQIEIDGSKVTMEMLQNDISLQYIVSINYGDYAWGMLSDQIAWESSDNTVASVNYYQGGYYSDIESYSYPSYLPATDFVAVGLKDGKTTITATHVQNGQQASVDVEVTRLKNQFYLFQFQPKAVTAVNYTNGDGEAIRLETNADGQLAVYEPSGIASNVMAKADVEGDTYVGIIENEDLLTGEQDITSLQLYPVNNLKMRLVSVAEIYVKDPDGNPAAGVTVTLRGGVYKNDKYCPDAYFGTNQNNFEVVYNGREDFKAVTDAEGKLTIKMDTMQFKTSATDIDMQVGETITYVFELRVGDGKTYAPDLIKITSQADEDLVASAPMAVCQLQTYNTSEKKPTLAHQYFQMYCTAADANGNPVLSPVSYADDVMNETGSIGPSLNYHTTILDSTVMYWTDPVTEHDENGYAILPSTITEKDRVVLKDENSKELPGQISVRNCETAITNLNDCYGTADAAMYVYPFSSMAIGRNAFQMDSDSFAYNSSTQDYDYLPQYETMNFQMDIIKGGKVVSNAMMPYGVINLLGVADPEDSIDSMIESVRKQLKQSSSVGAMMDQITDVVNPVLEIPFKLVSNLMFDSGLSTMYARIYPSNDPTVYRILIADIFEGDPVEFDNSTKVNNVAEVIEKKQAQEKENADVWYNKVISGYNKGRQSFGFAMEGYQILEAKCDKDGKWTLSPVAGHIFCQLPDITILSWTTDFLLGPVPAFVTFGIGFGLNMGYDYMTRNGSVDRLVLNTIRVYFDIGGGIGSGSLKGIFTLKLGIFFKMGLNVEFLRLFTENVSTSDTDFFGTGLVFNGEFSIRFELGIGPLTYTHNFLRVGYSLPAIGTGYYDNIVAYNETGNADDFIRGYTLQGDEYQVMGVDEDGLMLDITTARVDDRDYLERGNRAWYDDSQDVSLQALYSETENYAKLLQTNAYPKAYPVYTDDGTGMFYLTDLNVGTEPISAVAFADRSTGSTVDKGTIEEYHFYVRKNRAYYAKDYEDVYQLAGRTEENTEIDLVEYNAADNYIIFKFLTGDDTTTEFKMNDVASLALNKMYVTVETNTKSKNNPTLNKEIDAVDYNASSLVASGSNSKYFAAWVRQTEALEKEMGAAATNDDLGMALNAGEIVVVNGDGTDWSFNQLTDDSVADVNPQIASSGDKAVVVWQRVGSSTDPTEFDISNDVVYSYYDGAKWSDVQTVYSCYEGNVQELDVAMMDDGTALISYCVECTEGNDAEGDDTVEAFYSVVDETTATSDKATPVTRLSCNAKPDTTPHTVVVKEGSDTKFLMTWLEVEEYEDVFMGSATEDGESTSATDTQNNLRLALIDADGKQDPTFVESIAANDNLTIDDSYILMTSEDQKLENTHVMWTTTVNETDSDDTQHIYDVLMASKFYIDGDTEGLTAQNEVARLSDNVMIDHFDGYVDSTNCVQAVLFASDYSNPQLDSISTLELQGVDEPVQAALTSPESQMYTAYCKVPERAFTISEPTYSLSEMEPGYESPLYFTFTNAGATKLQSATLTLDGTQTKTYTFANGGLLPGESVSLTFNYTLPTENIHDVTYAVTAVTAEDTPAQATWLDQGTPVITINCPDVGITSFAVTEEGDAERELTVGLTNTSNMPLKGSEKVLKIAFYQDADMTKQIGETETISSSYYGLIDNAACTYKTTFTAAQIAELVQDDVTGNKELPSGEITLYTKVWLLNPDGSDFTETVESNNIAYTTFSSLLDRYRDKSLTEREDVIVSGINAVEASESTVQADVTLQNLSLGTRTAEAGNQLGNVRIAAYDAEGNQIGSAETFDFSQPSTDYYYPMTTEGELNVKPALTLEEPYTAADIADWDVTLFEDSYLMLYTWDNVVEEGVDKVVIPNGMFDDEDVYTIQNGASTYTYAGYEVDYGFTTSLTGEPTQGDRQFVGWYEVIGYYDGATQHLVGEDDFTAEDLAKIDFIANPEYSRILADEAYDFNTPMEKHTVLYALFTAMIVVDPEDTCVALPANKAVAITGRTDNALTDEIFLTLELVGDTFTDELVCGVEWPTNIDGIKVKVVEILPNSARDNNVIRVQVFGEAPEGFTGNLVIRPADADKKYFTLNIPVNSIASTNLTIDIKAFFQIHHKLEGMEAEEEQETTVGYMTVGSKLDPSLFKNNYTGYTYVSGTTGKEVLADKSTEITLNYNRNAYTIKYNCGTDPETGNPISAVTGSTPNTNATYDVIATLNACGYSYADHTFTGWNTKADGTGVSYAAGSEVLNLASSGDVTLYAQWAANGSASYKIEYYFQSVAEQGILKETVATYKCNEDLTDTVTGVLEGSTVSVGAKDFDGYEFSAGNRLNVTSGKVEDGLTLKLYYDLPEVMVNFQATGAQGGTTGQYIPGMAIEVPGTEQVSREGYTLKCWNTEADGSGTNLALTKMGYVKDLEGKLVYNEDEGKFESVTVGTESKERYSYTTIPNTVIATEDVTYYAIWEKNSYTVTFDANADEGDVVTFSKDLDYQRSGNTLVRTAAYGDAILAPEVTRIVDGVQQTFIGWYDSTDSKTANPAAKVAPNSDVTYYAVWSTPYTVKRVYQDIASVGSDEPVWDDTLTTTETMWGEIGELTEVVATPAAGFTPVQFLQQEIGENTVMEVQYLRNTYSIQFLYNGGKLTNPDAEPETTLVYDTVLTAPVVEKEGYVFAGWNKLVPEKVPAENVIFTAQWVEKPYQIQGTIKNLKDNATLVVELERNGTVVASQTFTVNGTTQTVDFGNCTGGIYQLVATMTTSEGSCSTTEVLLANEKIEEEESSKAVPFTVTMPALKQNAAVEVTNVNTLIGVSGMGGVLNANLNPGENVTMTLKINGLVENKDIENKYLDAIKKLVAADGNDSIVAFDLTMNKHIETLNVDGEVVAVSDILITDTNGQYVELAIPISDTTLTVYRLHNDEAETVGSELSRRYKNENAPHEGWFNDTEAGMLYVYVDQFSTFAIARPAYSGGGSGTGGAGAGGGGSTDVQNQATISDDIKNGTVELISKDSAEVLLNVVAEKGYVLNQLTVTDEGGNVYEAEQVDDTTYRITLMGSNIDISASFKIRFKDVAETAYYADPVVWAYQNDITVGMDSEQTLFAPSGITTRAQMVTFLWRALGEPKAEGKLSFTDVPEDAYYTEAVRWAVATGITNGTSNTTFSPDDEVTRAQVVTFLYRCAKGVAAAGTENPFTDVSETAYYADAVLWALGKQITTGTSETTFDPLDTCTRGQVVTFLYRYFND